MSEPRHVYYPASIMSRAWCLARAGARRFGGPARDYLAEALRLSWQVAREGAGRVAEMTTRVLASIASLSADIAACHAAEARLHADTEAHAARQIRRLEAEDDCPELRLAMAA